MKLLVVHDKEGSIVQLAAYPASQGIAVKPALSEGEQATELELELDADDHTAVAAGLADLRANYRVESDGDGGRLVKRD